MGSPQNTVLVTGAGGPLGVNLSHCLRQAPTPLSLIGTDSNRWHLPLAITDRVVHIPPARDLEPYAEALSRLLADVGVLIPTHPVEVRAVSSLVQSGRLKEVGTTLPMPSVLEATDDKYTTQQRLNEVGLPVPQTFLLRDEADLAAAFDTLPPPIWVRGCGAPGLGIGGAALPCQELEVARAWVQHHHGWGGMAASAYLPGRNLSWMSVFSKGELLASASRERLEYVLPHVSPSGITGAPAVSRTILQSNLTDLGERAVRTLDPKPNGVYFVDFKEDQTKVPHITEINAGRCGTTVRHYTEAGFNFPWLLVCLGMGWDLSWLPDSPYDVVPPDLYWVRTLDCGPALIRGDEGFDVYESLM